MRNLRNKEVMGLDKGQLSQHYDLGSAKMRDELKIHLGAGELLFSTAFAGHGPKDTILILRDSRVLCVPVA